MNKLIRKISALFIAITLVSTTYASAKTYAQRFWDVSKDYWAFEYIADLTERKVISGYEDGSFKPEKTVSRAEWAKMMVDASGVSATDETAKFTDMKNHWANKFVNAAKQYMTGYTDGTFRPDQSATREDVAVAMVLIKGYDTSDVDYSNLSFTDNDSISNYAKAYVSVAVQHGLISGFTDGSFRGQDTLTRAQAATLIYRAFQHGNADKVIGGGVEKAPTVNTDEEEYRKQAKPSNSISKSNTNRSDDTITSKNNQKTPDLSKDSYKYNIDTLVSVKNLDNPYLYTSDGYDTVFYVDTDAVKSVNIDSGKVKTITSLKDFNFTSANDATFSDIEISSIAWDQYSSKLILQGRYQKVTHPDNLQFENRFVFKFDLNGDGEIVTDSFVAENGDLWEDTGMSRILDITKNGDFITNNAIVSSDGRTVKGKLLEDAEHWIVDRSCAKAAKNTGNTTYFVTHTAGENSSYRICSYNFSTRTVIADYNGTAYGLARDKFAFIRESGELVVSNYIPSVLKTLDTPNIEVLDNTEYDGKNISEKLLILDSCIVVYDRSVNSFRIIRELQ